MSGDKGNVLAEMDAIDRGPAGWLVLCVGRMVRATEFEPSMFFLTLMFFRWMHLWIPLNVLAFLYWLN
jgi:hypothetical protein